MTKKAYLEHNVVGEITSAIELLCENQEYATPTDVLRLLKIEETNLSRTIVRDIACNNRKFKVVSSRRGYRITLDTLYGEIPF